MLSPKPEGGATCFARIRSGKIPRYTHSAEGVIGRAEEHVLLRVPGIFMAVAHRKMVKVVPIKTVCGRPQTDVA